MPIEQSQPAVEKEGSPLDRLATLVAEKKAQVMAHLGPNWPIEDMLTGVDRK
jgi:hypothetical protein